MKTLCRFGAACAAVMFCTPASAALFEFGFTGKYTLLDPSGTVLDQQSIASTLIYDSNAGTGSAPRLTIGNFDTFGATATLYDMSLQQVAGTRLMVGNMLVDWSFNAGVPLSMVWDASGLLNAIDFGLLAGDVISGTTLVRNGTAIHDVASATPASDGLPFPAGTLNQGPAPLAATTLNTSLLCTPGNDCIGNALSGGAPFSDDGVAGSPMIDGPFVGLNVTFDIGSGNSLTVLGVSDVPLPGAFWLFGSGLLALLRLRGSYRCTRSA